MSKKVLAVASAGGHWVQLMRLRPAFAHLDASYLTTNMGYLGDVDRPLYVVSDANMWKKWRLTLMFCEVAWVMIKVRPAFVLSTGAAPGFAAIVFGRLLGAKTIWLDSVANSEDVSGSGKLARRWAHVWLTQWEHLARPEGPMYWGSVL